MMQAQVADAFEQNQPLPNNYVSGCQTTMIYVSVRKNAYAAQLWAALQKGEDARARAASLGASRSMQERAARVAWRTANSENAAVR